MQPTETTSPLQSWRQKEWLSSRLEYTTRRRQRGSCPSLRIALSGKLLCRRWSHRLRTQSPWCAQTQTQLGPHTEAWPAQNNFPSYPEGPYASGSFQSCRLARNCEHSPLPRRQVQQPTRLSGEMKPEALHPLCRRPQQRRPRARRFREQSRCFPSQESRLWD